MSTKEDLSIILIERTLVIAHGRHILDHNGVIGVFALLVQHRIRLDHIIHNIRLGDLLGPELLLGAQVLAVVVPQVVVARDGSQPDAGVDEEVHQRGLHLRLPGLEVVAPDKGAVLRGQLDSARHKGVLRRAVDKGRVFEDAGYGEDGRGRHFLVPVFNGLEQVLCGVVHPWQNVGEALRVGGPLDDDLVEVVRGLEFTICIQLALVLSVRNGSY